MNRVDYLITCLAEECAEVTQRITKIQRFGLEEIQPGQELTNAERMEYELTDLFAVVILLSQEGIVKETVNSAAVREKQEKIEKYLNYSRELGIVE